MSEKGIDRKQKGRKRETGILKKERRRKRGGNREREREKVKEGRK